MWLLCGLILSLSISCEASSSLELLEVIVEVANVDCFRLLVKEVEESDGLLGGMAALVDLQGGTIKQAWTLGTKEEWRIHTDAHCLNVLLLSGSQSSSTILVDGAEPSSTVVIFEEMPNDTSEISAMVSGSTQIDSSFVFVDSRTGKVFELYEVKEHSPNMISICGNLTADNRDFSCLLHPDEKVRGPHDFRGQVLTASYDLWAPISFMDPNNPGKWEGTTVKDRGIFPDVFIMLGKKLNFTPKFVPNPTPGVYGMQVKDEVTGKDTSFNGMVGAIARGEVTTSVAGVSMSMVRAVVLDFPVSIAIADSAIVIRRPGGSAAIEGAYTSEFELEIWLAVIATNFTLLIGMTFIILMASRKLLASSTTDALKAFSESAQIILRGAVGKQPNVKRHKVGQGMSFKIALITILLGEMVVFAAYRSAMNAFLSVSLLKLPVSNLQDIHNLNYNLLIWKDSFLEDYIRSFHPDIYIAAEQKGRIRYISSTADGISNLLSPASPPGALFESPESIAMETVQMPCEVVRMEANLPFHSLSLPLRKDSPYTRIFNYELAKMVEAGTIDRLRLKYLPNTNEAVCKEEDILRQKPLGLDNIALPFSILVGSILLSTFVLLLEFLLMRSAGRSARMNPEAVSVTVTLDSLRDLLDSHELEPMEKILRAKEILLDGERQKTT